MLKRNSGEQRLRCACCQVQTIKYYEAWCKQHQLDREDQWRDVNLKIKAEAMKNVSDICDGLFPGIEEEVLTEVSDWRLGRIWHDQKYNGRNRSKRTKGTCFLLLSGLR